MQNVITRLNGGLGNQLFQYAAGRALAGRLGVPLKLDLSEFDTYELRAYELDKFTIRAERATAAELDGCIITPSRMQRIGSRLAISCGMAIDQIAFKEIRHDYDPAFGKIRRPVYLNGYWQSEKYFQAAENEVRNELCLARPLSAASGQALDEILSCSAVSLHIRRGDYVTNPSAATVHGVCSLAYYFAAIDHIAAHVTEPCFFVFSDDLQWAKDHLKTQHPIRFVDANGPDRGTEDMWLMQSCRHHIIANSSFSWWGAWLNGRKDKIVVAPQTWFLDKKLDSSDIIPKQWHKI